MSTHTDTTPSMELEVIVPKTLRSLDLVVRGRMSQEGEEVGACNRVLERMGAEKGEWEGRCESVVDLVVPCPSSLPSPIYQAIYYLFFPQIPKK